MNEYKSIFAPFFNSYLEEKQMQGFSTKEYSWALHSFDSFLAIKDKSNLHITESDIAEWTSSLLNLRKTTLYRRQCIVSNFCSYMNRLGYECYILGRSKTQAYKNYRPPVVFTHEQIQAIFKACDDIIIKKRYAKSIVIILPSLIRLLYSTGIRIGEALSIRNESVDFLRKTITIEDTKTKRQRLAPINNSLETVLKQYIRHRNKNVGPNADLPNAYLFVSALGKPCSQIAVYNHFCRIVNWCGIKRNPTQIGPSLHSLRHTAAVHSLIKMTREGKDVYATLPQLAVFMGHKSVLGTEYYVRLTHEVYPEVLKMNSSVTDDIFTSLILKLSQNHEDNY